MKTAISLPDSVFSEAEKLAQTLKMSRSELYSKAIAAFVKTHVSTSITKKLNMIYQEHDSTVDESLLNAQWSLLGKEEW